LHTEAVRCKFSVGHEVKTEIPAYFGRLLKIGGNGMKVIKTLAEWERAYSEATEFEAPQRYSVRMKVNGLPNPLRFAISSAVKFVSKYRLPCDVVIKELPAGLLAQHGWRKNGTCAVVLSSKLTFQGDKTSVHRRILHELAHHMAGRGHGHDERFRQIASDLYEREGYPRGRRGDHYGNM
jgi:hypothetical protein